MKIKIKNLKIILKKYFLISRKKYVYKLYNETFNKRLRKLCCIRQ